MAACSNGAPNISNRADVFDYVRSVDLAPRTPELEEVGIARGGRAPRAESYYGDAPLVTGAIPARGRARALS